MTRDEVLEEFRSDACDCECDAWACIVDRAMADEIVRLRAILAMLKQPSEKILLAAVEAVPYGASYAALQRCLPAAVTAAEQEVGA